MIINEYINEITSDSYECFEENKTVQLAGVHLRIIQEGNI